MAALPIISEITNVDSVKAPRRLSAFSPPWLRDCRSLELELSDATHSRLALARLAWSLGSGSELELSTSSRGEQAQSWPGAQWALHGPLMQALLWLILSHQQQRRRTELIFGSKQWHVACGIMPSNI